MKRLTVWPATLTLILGLVATGSRAGYVNHNFDVAPFINGATFTSPVLNWQASSASVMVTNAAAYTAPHSVVLTDNTSLSNRVNVAAPGVVWTDFRIRPTFGRLPHMPPTNTAAFVFCFNTNQHLAVYAAGGWLQCTNDIWGSTLPALTTNWVDLSVYQNYATTTMVVFVDGKIAMQDASFVTNAGAYNTFTVGIVDDRVYLDDVDITNTYPSGRLTADYNTNGIVDGLEVHNYGYAGRTLHVGAGLAYGTIQGAVNVWRPLDSIYVHGGIYNEAVRIGTNLTFAGESFTNSGSLDVAAGAALALGQSATLGAMSVTGTVAVGANTLRVTNLNLATGGQITVAGGQLVATSAGVNLSGTFALNASGASVAAGNTLTVVQSSTLAALSVTGTVAVGANTLMVTDLAMGSSALITVTGGRLVVAGAGVDMSGTFTIDGADWGVAAVADFPFADDFELYEVGSQLQNLKFRGWGASGAGSSVVGSPAAGGARAAAVVGLASNRVNGTAQTRVWTDLRVRPVPGVVDTAAPTNSAAFLFSVDRFGQPTYFANGWRTISSNAVGGAVGAVSSNAYARVTMFENFSTHFAALFLNGTLLVERVSIPLSAFSGMGMLNSESDRQARMDNIQIVAEPPADLTVDLDDDGYADAFEIHNYGSVSWSGPRTLFLFK